MCRLYRGWGWWNVAESTSTHTSSESDSTLSDDQRKTKKQLITELVDLRDQLAALESFSNEQLEITNFSRPHTPYGQIFDGSRMIYLDNETGSHYVRRLILQRDRAYINVRRQFEFTRAIMESLGEGVCALDHAGHFTRMNQAASAMLGWSGAELLGKDFHEKLHPSHASSHDAQSDERCSLMDVLRDGRTIHCEDVFARKNGTMFPVACVVSPIISDNLITGCVIAFHDITARKQLENALRQSERDAIERAGELAAIVEAMNDAIVVFNRDGHIIHANSAAWQFFRPDTTSIGLDLLHERMSRYVVRDEHGNLLANEDTPLFRILRGETLTNDNSVDIFMRMPDGRQVEVNISGAPFHGETGEVEGAVCIVRDVTERRKRERSTRETAAAALQRATELEAVLDAITDVVLVFDQDGRILRGNAAARSFLARKDTFSLLDMRAEERAPYYNLRDANGQPLPEGENPILRVLAGETITGANAVRITFRHFNGKDWQVQVSGAPLRDSQGHNCGAVCVFKASL